MEVNPRFVAFLAARYFASWRKHTVIVVAVVAGAVFLYALTSSTLSGLAYATLEKTLGLAFPHVEVEVAAGDYQRLASTLSGMVEVEAYSPRVVTEALAVHGRARAVRLIAAYGDLESRTTGVDSYVCEGAWPPGRGGCVVGYRLARDLGVGRGDRLVLVLPSGERLDLRVRGLLKTGIYDVDAYVVYVDIGELGRVSGNYSVAVRLRNPSAAEAVASRLSAMGYSAKPWQELAGNVLDLLRVEEFYSNALVASVLAITGLGIVNVMLMLTESQRKSIGVLKAVGATSAEVFMVYML